MTDAATTADPFAAAMQTVADGDRTRLQTIYDKVSAFRADMLAVVATIPATGAQNVQSRVIAAGLASSTDFAFTSQIPQLLRAYGYDTSGNLLVPATTTAAATPAASS